MTTGGIGGVHHGQGALPVGRRPTEAQMQKVAKLNGRYVAKEGPVVGQHRTSGQAHRIFSTKQQEIGISRANISAARAMARRMGGMDKLREKRPKLAGEMYRVAVVASNLPEKPEYASLRQAGASYLHQPGVIPPVPPRPDMPPQAATPRYEDMPQPDATEAPPVPPRPDMPPQAATSGGIVIAEGDDDDDGISLGASIYEAGSQEGALGDDESPDMTVKELLARAKEIKESIGRDGLSSHVEDLDDIVRKLGKAKVQIPNRFHILKRRRLSNQRKQIDQLQVELKNLSELGKAEGYCRRMRTANENNAKLLMAFAELKDDGNAVVNEFVLGAAEDSRKKAETMQENADSWLEVEEKSKDNQADYKNIEDMIFENRNKTGLPTREQSNELLDRLLQRGESVLQREELIEFKSLIRGIKNCINVEKEDEPPPLTEDQLQKFKIFLAKIAL